MGLTFKLRIPNFQDSMKFPDKSIPILKCSLLEFCFYLNLKELHMTKVKRNDLFFSGAITFHSFLLYLSRDINFPLKYCQKFACLDFSSDTLCYPLRLQIMQRLPGFRIVSTDPCRWNLLLTMLRTKYLGLLCQTTS